jgi:hypothetical protein
MGALVLLPSLVVTASLGDWIQVAVSLVLGTVLSGIVVVLLGVFGVADRLRERREEQKRKNLRQQKEREALESGGGPAIEGSAPPPPVDESPQAIKARPSWSPDREDRAPEGSQLLDALRRLWDDLRDLIDLGVSWVGLFYLFLLSAIGWLDSLMLRLGFSEDAATSAVVVDAVLVALTGAWLLTGIRTRKRAIGVRLLETSALVVVCLGAGALVVATGSVVYGGLCVLFGGIAFLKGFS